MFEHVTSTSQIEAFAKYREGVEIVKRLPIFDSLTDSQRSSLAKVPSSRGGCREQHTRGSSRLSPTKTIESLTGMSTTHNTTPLTHTTPSR
jgi:hypothetical protein